MIKLADCCKLFRTSIVLRSVVLVLLVSTVVGALLVAGISKYIRPTIEKTINARLDELVKTVSSTASIASFVGDRALAAEVARGLLMNRDVERVLITADQGVLTDLKRGTANGSKQTLDPDAPLPPVPTENSFPAGTVMHTLDSPFKPGIAVGRIIVLRNQASISQQVAEGIEYIRMLILMQTGTIILVIMAIAIFQIARPIQRTAQALNDLSVLEGEQLDIPAGHQHNEIGQLVNNINQLVSRLVQGLNSERELRLERELEERRFRMIFENAETGIFVIDQTARLKSCNPAFRRTMGLSSEEQNLIALGQPVSLLNSLQDRATQVLEKITLSLREGRSHSFELSLKDAQGQPRWLQMILNPVENEEIQGVINDITESKLREAHANRLALTDPLTGLGNRLGFEHRFDQLINEYREDPQRYFTLMMIDLDRFKQVNDTHGHDAGDLVLINVAQHIERSIRKSDFAARLGGDEFVVLLPFVVEESIIQRLATTLITNISQPVNTDSGVGLSVGASIGISRMTAGIQRREDLIKRADLALYEAKNAGRGQYRIFAA